MPDSVIGLRRIRSGLIHYTDQGAPPSCVAYQQQLIGFDLPPSMSRKGNCYDNAVAEESFFGTLKNDLVPHQTYHTLEKASREIFAFIEGFHNR